MSNYSREGAQEGSSRYGSTENVDAHDLSCSDKRSYKYYTPHHPKKEMNSMRSSQNFEVQSGSNCSDGQQSRKYEYTPLGYHQRPQCQSKGFEKHHSGRGQLQHSEFEPGTNPAFDKKSSFYDSSATRGSEQKNMIFSLRSEIYNLKSEVTKLIEREPQSKPFHESKNPDAFRGIQKKMSFQGSELSSASQAAENSISKNQNDSRRIDNVPLTRKGSESNCEYMKRQAAKSPVVFSSASKPSDFGDSYKVPRDHKMSVISKSQQKPKEWQIQNSFQSKLIREDFPKRADFGKKAIQKYQTESQQTQNLRAVRSEFDTQGFQTASNISKSSNFCKSCKGYENEIRFLKEELGSRRETQKRNFPDEYAQQVQHQQKQFEQKIAMLQQSLVTSVREKQELRKEIESEKEKVCALKKELSISKEELEDSKRVVEQVRLSISLKNELLDKLEVQLRNATNVKEALSASVSSLRDKVEKSEGLKKQAEELKAQAELLQSQQRRWMKDVEYWKRQYEAAESSLNEVRLTSKQHQAALSVSEAQVDRLKKELRVKEQSVSKLAFKKLSDLSEPSSDQTPKSIQTPTVEAEGITLEDSNVVSKELQRQITANQILSEQKKSLEVRVKQHEAELKERQTLKSPQAPNFCPKLKKNTSDSSKSKRHGDSEKNCCELSKVVHERERVIENLLKDLGGMEHELKLCYQIRSNLSSYSDSLNRQLLESGVRRLNQKYEWVETQSFS